MLEFNLKFTEKHPKLIRIFNQTNGNSQEGLDLNLGLDLGEWDLDFELHESSDLFSDGICLDSVTIDQKSNSVHGSIMVRTFSYKSQVFISIVDSNSDSDREIPGQFIRREFGTDFIEFHLDLPKNSNSLEFKVGLRVGRAVFWDDNNGKNYRVSKRSVQ